MPISPKEASDRFTAAMKEMITAICDRIDSALVKKYNDTGEFRIIFANNANERVYREVVNLYKDAGWHESRWEYNTTERVAIILRVKASEIMAERG